MGTALQIGDILSARVWTSLGEQAAVNSYNWEVITVSGGTVTDQQFSDSFDLLVAGDYKQMMPTSCTYHGTQTYFMRRTGFLPAPVKTITNTGAGVTGTDPVPRSSAAIMKYSTLVRGPGGRGRVYLPFISTQYMTALGLPNATLNTKIDALAALLLPALTLTTGGSSATLVWSLLTRGVPPAPPTAHQLMNAESAGKMGTMRKRGDYGRANASPI